MASSCERSNSTCRSLPMRVRGWDLFRRLRQPEANIKAHRGRVCITPGPNQVLYAADAFPGRLYKLSLDGKILGVLGRAGKQPKQFGWIHEIACPSENELYVAEIVNWRVQKLILHPEKAQTRTSN